MSLPLHRRVVEIFEYIILLVAISLPIQASGKDALEELLAKYSSKSAPALKTEKLPNLKTVEKVASPQRLKAGNLTDSNRSNQKASGPYSIQIASFRDQQDAVRLAENMREDNLTVVVATANVDGKNWHRILVGKFDDFNGAKQYLNSNSKRLNFSSEALIVQHAASQPEPVPVIDPSIERNPASTTAARPTAVTEDLSPSAEKDESEFVFSDWAGLRTTLLDKGYDFTLRYKADSVTNFGGGSQRSSTTMGNLDLYAEFDFEKIFGIDGLKFVAYGLENHGGNASDVIGNAITTSNIEAPNAFKIYELYLKKAVDDRFAFVVGLRDLNADFYHTPSSGTLINSSFGIGPSIAQTGINGPSIFPNAAPAVTFSYVSPSDFYIHSGVFNAQAGDPDISVGTRIPMGTDHGYLHIFEFGVAREKSDETFKYSLGAWTYTNDSDALDTSKPSGRNAGFYLLLDHNLSEQSSVFFRHGVAAPDYNQFSSSTEFGFSFLGLLPGRNKDVFSIGYSTGYASNDYQTSNDSTADESIIEVCYRIEAFRGVSLIPDFQYVKNPGLLKGVDDALVGGARIEVNF